MYGCHRRRGPLSLTLFFFSLERLDLIPELLIYNTGNDEIINIRKLFEKCDTEVLVRLARFIKKIFSRFKLQSNDKIIAQCPPYSPTYKPVEFTSRGRKVKIPHRLNL